MRKYNGKIKNPTKQNEYRRKLSIRKKVIGSSEKPRVCVNKTNKHLRVQVIDDSKNVTLFSAQSFGKNKVAEHANIEGAKKLGSFIAAELKKAKIEKAVFDRNGKLYTGVIKIVADSIRENGIQL
jgi:large subunit ribosomal protein L18